MKPNRIIFILAVALFSISCEKVITISDKADDNIVISAIATPDTIFSAYISKSAPLSYAILSSELYDKDLYESEYLLPEAHAMVKVNGEKSYFMEYAPNKHCFISDYVPQEGDEISLTVSSLGLPATSAYTKVNSKPQIEVLEWKVLYDKYKGTEWSNPGLSIYTSDLYLYGVDTIMRMKLKIIDPPGEKNYYRLLVRGEATRPMSWSGVYHEGIKKNDVFESDAPIFKDEVLSLPFQGWPATFTNVFEDNLFDGQEYTFTVDSRKLYGWDRKVMVELQSISYDLYLYLKSIMVCRIKDSQQYADPVLIHTNIKNGFGILGSISTNRNYLSYPPNE